MGLEMLRNTIRLQVAKMMAQSKTISVILPNEDLVNAVTCEYRKKEDKSFFTRCIEEW